MSKLRMLGNLHLLTKLVVEADLIRPRKQPEKIVVKTIQSFLEQYISNYKQFQLKNSLERLTRTTLREVPRSQFRMTMSLALER
jgi:hypothetical protein